MAILFLLKMGVKKHSQWNNVQERGAWTKIQTSEKLFFKMFPHFCVEEWKSSAQCGAWHCLLHRSVMDVWMLATFEVDDLSKKVLAKLQGCLERFLEEQKAIAGDSRCFSVSKWLTRSSGNLGPWLILHVEELCFIFRRKRKREYLAHIKGIKVRVCSNAGNSLIWTLGGRGGAFTNTDKKVEADNTPSQKGIIGTKKQPQCTQGVTLTLWVPCWRRDFGHFWLVFSAKHRKNFDPEIDPKEWAPWTPLSLWGGGVDGTPWLVVGGTPKLQVMSFWVMCWCNRDQI